MKLLKLSSETFKRFFEINKQPPKIWSNPVSDIFINIPLNEKQVNVSLNWTIATLLRKIKSNTPKSFDVKYKENLTPEKEENLKNINEFILSTNPDKIRPLFSFLDKFNNNITLDLSNITISDLYLKKIKLFGSRVFLEKFSFNKQSLTWKDPNIGFGDIGTGHIPKDLPLREGLYILLRDVSLSIFWFKENNL